MFLLQTVQLVNGGFTVKDIVIVKMGHHVNPRLVHVPMGVKINLLEERVMLVSTYQSGISVDLF